MYKKVWYVFFSSMAGILLFYACTMEVEPILDDERLTLTFRWVPGTEVQTQEQMITGLTWTLSTLGAKLPVGSLSNSMDWRDDRTFELNLNLVGFEREPLIALSRILSILRESEEYRQAGAIDLGRFVMLTLNSSYHYYAITGLPETITEFRQLYDFEQKRLQVTHSTITSVDRLIEIAEADTYSQIAHIGGESGSPFSAALDFMPVEFETLDMMPNGQLRFGLYGSNGRLKASANEAFTAAGKPSKCLWCHEVVVQTLFQDNAVLENGNSLTQEEFVTLRDQQMDWIIAYRQNLTSDLDFAMPRDHERMEKIYEDFMEPSVQRLALEWSLSIQEVESRLASIPTHSREGQEGFYDRKDIDTLGPYDIIRVPDFARERSDYEPDFF